MTTLQNLVFERKLQLSCMSVAPPLGWSHAAVQHDNGANEFCEKTRLVLVKRKKRNLGLILYHSSLAVNEVVKGSPAEEAEIRNGDRILAVNGIDLRDLSPTKTHNLLQGSGSMPSLIIQSSTGSLPHPVPASSYSTSIRSCNLLNEKKTQARMANHLRRRSCTNLQNFSTSWTSAFVPDDFLYEEKSFKEQIENLLSSEENETLRQGFVDFSLERNIDILLFALYPILSIKRREGLWQYVLVYLTQDEEKLLRQRLFELVNVKLSSGPGLDRKILAARSDDRKLRKQSICDGVDEQLTSSCINLLGDPSHNDDSAFPTSDNLPSPVVIRRQRRRRSNRKSLDVENNNNKVVDSSDIQHSKPTGFSKAEQTGQDALIFSSTQSTINQHRSTERQQRRREHHLARQHNLAENSSQTSTKVLAAPSQLISPIIESKRILQLNQNKSQVNVIGMSVANQCKGNINSIDLRNSTFNKANFLLGDKKKKHKAEASTSLPSTAIDDVVTKTSGNGKSVSSRKTSTSGQLKSTTSPQNDIKETKGSVSEDLPNHRRPSGSGNTGNRLEFDPQKSGFCRSPEFDSTFLDDSKQKKNYLNALKKRLTFSNPPKNSDTDTFLCEISAQFDAEMNLLDDIEIAEDDSKDHKFGEKWSYLPKPEHNRSATEPSVLNDPLLEAVKELDSYHMNITSGFRANHKAFDQSDKNQFLRDPIPEADDAPPFPTNLGNISPPSATSASQLTNLPQEAQHTRPNREERVRRRRRRNPDTASKKSETARQSTPQEEIPSRRLSVPLQVLLQSDESARQDDAVIYDVPKPATTVAPLRRPHVNVEKRTRRSRANRRNEKSKRNSTELRMHVWNENDFANPTDGVKMRSSSPVDQATFFDRAKKKNFRVSGVSIAMEDMFSRAEEDLDSNSFASAPNIRPPTPLELSEDSHHQSRPLDIDEIYAPLQDEVLAMGLAYDEQDEEDEEETPQSSEIHEITDLSMIPSPPPPPPAVPPPPPPPLSPPLMYKNTPPSSPNRVPVKRINWEKIEPADLTDTVWGQLGDDHETIKDVVKYMELEEHFAMKKAKDLRRKNMDDLRSDAIHLLAHKKAYNTSILLAHLKLSHRQICDCLMITGSEQVRKRMDSSHYKQLLMYAPNQEEVDNLKSYTGDMSKLNEVDVLAIRLVNIPGYHLRLKALMFKHSFCEKEEEIQKNLEVIQRASMQLRKSRKLAKILEFVLAMGNYMNRGHIRISKATGFRIHFLAEMDLTKTSDNKLTFLHILARAVITKFPDVVTFPSEITDVKAASRVLYPAVVEELQEQRKLWLHIRDNLHETVPKSKHDKFKIAMETCLVRTNGSLKRLEQLQNSTVKEFHKAAKYFGENPKNIGMQQFFKIFDEFTNKFERSHHEVRKFVKNRPHHK